MSSFLLLYLVIVPILYVQYTVLISIVEIDVIHVQRVINWRI